MGWASFDGGATIGQRGSEDGRILRDEEYEGAARITLEQGASRAPFSITCGIYGWFFHTRHLGPQEEAEGEFERMRQALATIVAGIPITGDPAVSAKMDAVTEAIGAFVARFP